MTEKTADEGRRAFLKLAGVGAPAAVAAAVATPETAEAAVEEKGDGLRKTAHVQAYLDSARF